MTTFFMLYWLDNVDTYNIHWEIRVVVIKNVILSFAIYVYGVFTLKFIPEI